VVLSVSYRLEFSTSQLTSLLDPPPSSSINVELLFPFPDLLALILLDPRGESTCQLPGREACKLIGLFFNVPIRDLGLEGRDRAGGEFRRASGTSAPGLINDAIVAVLGTGAGEEGRNGIFTREWLDGIFIDRSICR
jgi:hypothetical protein